MCLACTLRDTYNQTRRKKLKYLSRFQLNRKKLKQMSRLYLKLSLTASNWVSKYTTSTT